MIKNDEYVLQPFLTYFKYNFPDFIIQNSKEAMKYIRENGENYIKGKFEICEIKNSMQKLKENLEFIIKKEKETNTDDSIISLFSEFMEKTLK